jgi:glycosyltransferase involved in cell wall biosynthesis
MDNRCVAILGRADTPTDAVEEYCRYLASALAAQGITLEIARLQWPGKGWTRGLKELSDKFPTPQNKWFLLQYTALAWSRRGFPWRFLRVLRHFKKNGALCAVVFHDAETYFGSRLIDRVRRVVQLHTMRHAARLADLSVFTIPPDKIPWITDSSRKTVSIPVGANLPSPELAWPPTSAQRAAAPTVAVFSLSEGSVGAAEVKAIAEAVQFAAKRLGPLRLLVLGRNSELARSALQIGEGATRVEVVIHGIRPAHEIVQLLGSSDAMLFVRGPLSARRGSAIAGIACGLPVIGRAGWETASPITDAGVVLVSAEQAGGFGPALLQVLSDASFRTQLVERSKQAYQQYFCWQAIATQFKEALKKYGPPPVDNQ